MTSSALPLAVVPQCLDVLRQLSSNERDLIRVVVEIVGDLREPGDEDDPDAADQTQDSIVSTAYERSSLLSQDTLVEPRRRCGSEF